MTQPIKLANLRMLELVATQLGDLCKEVVFLGGCTTTFFLTDVATPDARYTLDVDCIVDVISLNQYHQFEKRLLQQGFTKSIHDEVICRWRYEDLMLDVMPTDEKILGFGNRWYKAAIHHATQHKFSNDICINLITAPYFLATKLEAFKTRGNQDFLASHDFEDIVSIIDGRPELLEEIEQSEQTLKDYIAHSFRNIYNHRAFHDALPGHLIQYGKLADDRATIFTKKVMAIGQVKPKLIR